MTAPAGLRADAFGNIEPCGPIIADRQKEQNIKEVGELFNQGERLNRLAKCGLQT